MQVKINKNIIALFENTSLVREIPSVQFDADKEFLDNLITEFKTINSNSTKFEFTEYVKKSVTTLSEILNLDKLDKQGDLLVLSEFVYDQTY